MTITSDYDTILRQSRMLANDYLITAIESIDTRLGNGYAANHPDLIAAFMHVAVQDETMTTIALKLQEIAQALTRDYEAGVPDGTQPGVGGVGTSDSGWHTGYATP